MNPFKFTLHPRNAAIRDIATSPQKVTITEIRPCCFVVTLNQKPMSEFSELEAAQQYAKRWGWRSDVKTVGPAPLVDECTRTPSRFRMGANERTILALGPVVSR